MLRAALLCAGMAIAMPALAQSAEQQEIQRLIRENQHAKALKVIDDYLAKNPKDPNMRFRRGVALSMLDRKNEALGVFQKLVEDHPDMPAPYNNMAVLYAAQGEYDKARASLERAIRTNPDYATAYQNLGDVYAQLASQAYAKALQLDKTDASVPPKLALLRELASAPGTSTGNATVLASATQTAVDKRPAAPIVVSAAKPASAPVVASAPAVAAPKPAPSASAASAPSVVAAASAPKPSAPPAPKPADAALASIGEVEAAVRAWASAWTSREMGAYFAAYSPEFSGQLGSRGAWEQERRDRIAARKRIRVVVSDLQVSVNGDKAQARFRQSYESDSLDVTSRKTLELVRSASGKWVIRRESVGG